MLITFSTGTGFHLNNHVESSDKR